MKEKISREKRITRTMLILELLKNLDPKNAYGEYIAAKIAIPHSNVCAILNQLFLQGKVTKRKGHYRKVYYSLVKSQDAMAEIIKDDKGNIKK